MGWNSGTTGSPSLLRVLVVDDSVDLARLVTWLLRHCGFDAQMVFDGRRVLEVARTFKPHFILLDIRLPGLNGYQVADLIRKDPDLKSVVIIAVSAYDSDLDSACVPRAAAFQHHLIKPFGLEDLLSLLRAS